MFNESLFDSFDSFGEECVNPSFQVICENNKSVIYFNYGQHQARAIIATTSSSSSSFHYIITGVTPHNNCSVINSFSLPYENVSFFTDDDDDDQKYMMVMRCKKPVDYHDADYWDISSEKCGGEETQYYSYVAMNGYFRSNFAVRNVEESCRIEMKLTVSMWDGKVKCNRKCVYPEVHSEYVNGIDIHWRPYCGQQKQDDKDSDREGRRKQRLSLICILFQTAFRFIDMSLMRKCRYFLC
jgi:hypothetical protein